MSKRERNLVVLLALVALVTSPWWPIWSDQGTDRFGIDQSANQMFESLRRQQADMPNLDLSGLMDRKQPFTGAQRNLFEFGQVRAEEEPVEIIEENPQEEEDYGDPLMVTESPVRETQEARPAQRQRLSGYECLGIFIREEASYATFQWREQIFVGTEGDMINDAFRIEKIKEDGVSIFVLDGEYNQQLKMNSPAGPQGD